jgi:two-component system LytT family sensor kinase
MTIEIFTSKLKEYRRHIISWAVFIVYETVVIGFYSGSFGHPLTYAAHYLIIILFFYLHACRSLPWGLKQPKQILWRMPTAMVLEILLFIAANYVVDFILVKIHTLSGPVKTIHDLQYIMKILYRCLYFILFSTGYYLLETYIKERKRTNELEKQQLQDTIERQEILQEMAKAQNAFLLAQINPHFFFNTLDFLYHQVEFTTPVAAKAVSTLSAMMRFAIDADKVGDFILVGQEVEQIDNLLYLNQLRQKLDIRFQVADEVMSLQMIPLVLLTLAENVFKHGNLKAGNMAVINIYISDEYFITETDNAIDPASHISGTKTGLINTARRLEYAYGDKSNFKYGVDNDGRFRLRLQLPLALLKTAVSSKA